MKFIIYTQENRVPLEMWKNLLKEDQFEIKLNELGEPQNVPMIGKID